MTVLSMASGDDSRNDLLVGTLGRWWRQSWVEGIHCAKQSRQKFERVISRPRVPFQ